MLSSGHFIFRLNLNIVLAVFLTVLRGLIFWSRPLWESAMSMKSHNVSLLCQRCLYIKYSRWRLWRAFEKLKYILEFSFLNDFVRNLINKMIHFQYFNWSTWFYSHRQWIYIILDVRRLFFKYGKQCSVCHGCQCIAPN